jgi:cysteine sulfinate desulfinase/cysteine desulfurase-like protein
MLTVHRRFELPGVVRVSLGIENSEGDVDTLIQVLGSIARQSRGGSPGKRVKQQLEEFSNAAARRVYS